MNGLYSVTMQPDGNFVIYNNSSGAATGTTDTYNYPGARLAMQTDCNVVVYNSANSAVKYTGTAGRNGCRFTMQDDGNLVLYDVNNTALWALSYNTAFMRRL
jgi:hypothetical protein